MSIPVALRPSAASCSHCDKPEMIWLCFRPSGHVARTRIHSVNATRTAVSRPVSGGGSLYSRTKLCWYRLSTPSSASGGKTYALMYCFVLRHS